MVLDQEPEPSATKMIRALETGRHLPAGFISLRSCKHPMEPLFIMTVIHGVAFSQVNAKSQAGALPSAMGCQD